MDATLSEEELQTLIEYIKFGDTFNYWQNEGESGELTPKEKEHNRFKYISCVVRIFNLFLEFGFLNKPKRKTAQQEAQDLLDTSLGAVKGTVSGIGGALSYYAGSLWGSSVTTEPEKPKEENSTAKDPVTSKVAKLYQPVDEEAFKEIRKELKEPDIIFKVRHYWDRVKDYPDVESIKFVNHQSTDTQHRNRLGLRWILLALCNKGSPEGEDKEGDLDKAFDQVYQDKDLMLLYDQK